jgi:tetratricopeptide (TPR) repeat protein
MKTTIAILILITSFAALAADKYTDQMTANIQLVYNAQTTDELKQAVNAFERIGNAEKTKWEPFYYAAFGNIMIAAREKDGSKKDLILDQAESFLAKATAIKPNDSEIITLEGFVYTLRLTVDPATRGQKYSMLAMQAFGKALELNPDNPRALSLMAQMQYGTAKFFGSSIDEACSTATKAIEKFETFESDNVLAPQWGKKNAEDFKGVCK